MAKKTNRLTKKPFQFHPWMGVVAIAIVAVVGLVVIRFSNASQFPAIPTTETATTPSGAVRTNPKTVVLVDHQDLSINMQSPTDSVAGCEVQMNSKLCTVPVGKAVQVYSPDFSSFEPQLPKRVCLYVSAPNTDVPVSSTASLTINKQTYKLSQVSSQNSNLWCANGASSVSPGDFNLVTINPGSQNLNIYSITTELAGS